MTSELAKRAYLSNIDGVPWNCQSQLVNNNLVIERSNDEAGNLNIPWISPEHGPLIITTTSLMQRPEAYQLEVELARGTLNRLRNAISIASLSGWSVPPAILDEMKLSQQLFIRAATSQHIPSQAAHWAQESLTHSLKAAEDFALQRARFLLHQRQQQDIQLSTLLATRCESSQLRQRIRKSLPSTFNSMGVTTSWKRISPDADKFKLDNLEKQIRWCHRKGMKVIAGPLVQLDSANVPDWVYLWEDDFPTIESYFQDYIREVVTRFSDQVHIWNAVANMNVDNCLSLSEENLLHLAVSSIETLRQYDNQTPLVVTISQPWGEYLAGSNKDMSPMMFAELLLRADLGINGIGLEINWDANNRDLWPRDLLALSQQIDRWSQLGMPLVVYLTLSDKASSADDPGNPPSYNSDDTVSFNSRSRNVLSVLTSKPAVQAIIWNQLTDSKHSHGSAAGLFDANGKAKPILKDLHDLRHNYLA